LLGISLKFGIQSAGHWNVMGGILNVDPNGVHLVRVTTDEKEHRLWVAATAREEAVDRVLNAVPEGWSARLLDDHLKPRRDAIRTMALGEVRELSK
jgi:hypothetical protein